MKLDLAKLPVGEAVIGFLLVATIITFALAFKWVDDQGEAEEPIVSETPAPTEGGTPGNEIAISMGDNFFDPDQVTVLADQQITVNLTNEGSAIHNMVIAGPDGEYGTDDDAISDPEIVSGGQEAVVTWTSPAEPGEIDFRCAFHPQQMTGTITVQ
jgi:plastocyanin